MATAYHTDSVQQNVSSLAEDLTDYIGRAVCVTEAGVVSLCNDTDQATTEALVPYGIIITGAPTTSPQDLEVCSRPGSIVFVTAAETVAKGEPGMVTYSGTSANRARMGNRAGNTVAAGDWIWGYFLGAATAGNPVMFMFSPYPYVAAS
jgi:hypothetical protein